MRAISIPAKIVILIYSISLILQAQVRYAETIVGRVVDAETGFPLAGVNVRVMGSLIGAATDSSGVFVVGKLKPGVYALEISFVGYKPVIVQGVRPGFELNEILDVKLLPEPIKLSEVVVGPGTFSLSSSVGSQLQFSKLELKVLPMGIDDPLRVLQLLPGTNSDYLNAKIGIRGSRPDDALYLIDGMEIYGSIFHMDRAQGSRTAELNGLLSVIDGELIDQLYLSLGGFPSKYGNKSGGVLGIKTVRPDAEGIEGSVSLGIARIGGLLKAKQGKHTAVISAQRGYFDLVFGLFGQNTNLWPFYYDLFGKYEYVLPSGRLFAQILYAKDKIDFTETPSSDKKIQSTNYSLAHAWAGLDLMVSLNLSSSTIIYSSILPEKTWYDASDPSGPNFMNYEKDAALYGIKQTAVYDISRTFSLEAGLNVKYTTSRYSFHQTYEEAIGDTSKIVRSEQTPHGYDVGSYLSSKISMFQDAIMIDLGVRFDHQTYIPRGNRQWSPRLSIAAQLPYETIVRAGTGLYHQPADIANVYNYSPRVLEVSKSTHYLLGLENRYVPRSEIRVEAYYKRLQPEIRWLLRQGVPISMSYGYAYGLDAFVKKQFDSWFFRFGYAYGMAQDVAEKLYIFRSLDRRHSFSLNLNLAAAGGWNFSTTYRYATGRPYTNQYFEKVSSDTGTSWKRFYGFPNGERGTIYSQWNVSISKRTEYSWGKLSWYIHFLNLLNRQGVVFHSWRFVGDGKGGMRPVEANSIDMPFLITFGITWEF